MPIIKATAIFAVALLTIACSTAPSPAPAPEKPATVGSIVRLDPAFDELVPKDAQLEKLADGFTFTEGPIWRPSGVLWFSDVVGNVVRQWSPDGKVTEILNPGGYDGKSNLPAGGYNGPNGMTADKDGAVLLCQHGYRRIVRISKNMKIATVVDKEEGVQDGMKVDSKGNIWASGPAGIWVFSPAGKHLGTIKIPEIPANCNWGDDWKSLYITARTGLYRIKLAVAGEKQLYQ